MSRTAVGQTREREVQLLSFHVYQEERMLIVQIFDNVFPASVIPSPFTNAIRTPLLSSSVSLNLNGSIHLGPGNPSLSTGHTSVWPCGEKQRKTKSFAMAVSVHPQGTPAALSLGLWLY